jgi:hypothetical protein
MAKENDVHLVKSIDNIDYTWGRKINGTPPTSNV